MRRLNLVVLRRASRLLRHIHSREEGAVAVVVAILLVVLLGFTALAVDVGAVWAERRELQNGADAAALAVAQDCAVEDCDGDGTYGGTKKATAEWFADDNASDNASLVQAVRVPGDFGSATVTVETLSETDGQPVLPFRFAPILGFEDAPVTAAATAAWGNIGGAVTLPITISVCEWDKATNNGTSFADPDNPPAGGETWLVFHDGNTAETCEHHSNSGLHIPGGFGWLDDEGHPDDAGCGVHIEAGRPEPSKVGRPAPGDCSSSDFANMLGRVVLIPIFIDAREQGSNGEFDIWGFGAFYVTSYAFKQDTGNLAGYSECRDLVPGNGQSEDCLSGFFTQFVDIGGTLDPGAPDLGGTTVTLID